MNSVALKQQFDDTKNRGRKFQETIPLKSVKRRKKKKHIEGGGGVKSY